MGAGMCLGRAEAVGLKLALPQNRQHLAHDPPADGHTGLPRVQQAVGMLRQVGDDVLEVGLERTHKWQENATQGSPQTTARPPTHLQFRHATFRHRISAAVHPERRPRRKGDRFDLRADGA